MSLLSSAISAFNQAALIVGAAVFLLIGAAIFADHFYWRLRAALIPGTIKGLRADGAGPPTAEPATAAAPERATWGGFFRNAQHHPFGAAVALIFVALFLTLPAAMIGIGAYRAGNYVVLKLTGRRAEAVVVRNEARRGSKGVTYGAVIDFRDAQGRLFEVKDGMSKGGSPIFDQGERLAVYYDPADPRRWVMDKFWYVPGLGLGLVALGCGILLLIVTSAAGRGGRQAGRGGDQAARPAYAGERVYYPVYEYVAADGGTVEAESDSGSSALVDKEPGRTVKLLVIPSKPGVAREVGWLWLVFSMVFLGASAVLFSIAFGSFHTSLFTFIALGCLLLGGASKVAAHMRPIGGDSSAAAFVKASMERLRASRAALPLLDHDAWAARMRWRDGYCRKWLVVYLLAPLALLGAGYYTGATMLDLVAHGSRTTGAVVRFESERGSANRTVYYAVARYRDADGRMVEFRDRFGASTPIGSQGDSVEVRYRPADPAGAIIDRGLWNWLVPGLCSAAGLLLLCATIRCWAGIARRAAAR